MRKRFKKDLCGYAEDDGVAISSSGFLAQAYYKKGSPINVVIKKDNGKWLNGHYRDLIIGYLCLIVIGTILIVLSLKGQSETMSDIFIFLALVMGLMTYTAFYRLRTSRLVLGFHGAEHKVINAMETFEKYDISVAESCSPIHARCSTNDWAFIFVMLFINLLVIALSSYWFGSVFIWLFTWLLVLVLELLYPGYVEFNFISKYTQSHFSVCEPKPHELLTAHCAMLGALKAYGENVEMPDGVTIKYEE